MLAGLMVLIKIASAQLQRQPIFEKHFVYHLNWEKQKERKLLKDETASFLAIVYRGWNIEYTKFASCCQVLCKTEPSYHFKF